MAIKPFSRAAVAPCALLFSLAYVAGHGQAQTDLPTDLKPGAAQNCQVEVLPTGSSVYEHLPEASKRLARSVAGPTPLGTEIMRSVADLAVPRPETIDRIVRSAALFAHTLAYWNEGLSVEQAQGAVMHSIETRGLHDGLMVPLLELVDRSWMIGRYDVASVSNIALAQINPRLAATLCQRLGLQTTLPSSSLGNARLESIDGDISSVSRSFDQVVGRLPARKTGANLPAGAPFSEIIYGDGTVWREAQTEYSAPRKNRGEVAYAFSDGPATGDKPASCMDRCEQEAKEREKRVLDDYGGVNFIFKVADKTQQNQDLVYRNVYRVYKDEIADLNDVQQRQWRCEEKCIEEKKEREAKEQENAPAPTQGPAVPLTQNQNQGDQKPAEPKGDSSRGAASMASMAGVQGNADIDWADPRCQDQDFQTNPCFRKMETQERMRRKVRKDIDEVCMAAICTPEKLGGGPTNSDGTIEIQTDPSIQMNDRQAQLAALAGSFVASVRQNIGGLRYLDEADKGRLDQLMSDAVFRRELPPDFVDAVRAALGR